MLLIILALRLLHQSSGAANEVERIERDSWTLADEKNRGPDPSGGNQGFERLPVIDLFQVRVRIEIGLWKD
jgi:hypothetical protein